jgi:endonuclease/exonuclease/phosphatase family metal-dependent hydrolase
MSFNVRQPDQEDGPNGWEYRRDLLVDTILEKDPDLIGTQELFTLQADYILAGAPQYDWFGSGRFGDTHDKHVGIFYRKDLLRLISYGDFWLSETPDEPGSSSWEIIRPRQVTWGLFETPWAGRFVHFNTHFPYRRVEEEARRKTAALVLERIARLDATLTVLLTGDFNSPAGGDIYESLTAELRDAWHTAERRIGPEGTVHGFGKVAGGRRIDWILYRAAWAVREAETVTHSRNGLYPSDHFPAMAVFELS